MHGRSTRSLDDAEDSQEHDDDPGYDTPCPSCISGIAFTC